MAAKLNLAHIEGLRQGWDWASRGFLSIFNFALTLIEKNQPKKADIRPDGEALPAVRSRGGLGIHRPWRPSEPAEAGGCPRQAGASATSLGGRRRGGQAQLQGWPCRFCPKASVRMQD